MFRYLLIVLSMFFLSCGGEIGSDLDGIDANFSWADIDLDGNGIKENYVTFIKNQLCNDCYIYGALGALEIQYKIDHRTLEDLNLSEQNIHNCMKYTCNGTGNPENVLDYVRQYGVMEEKYSLTGMWNSCENCFVNTDNIPYYSLGGHGILFYSNQISYEEKKKVLVRSLKNGPVIVDFSMWGGLANENNYIVCKNAIPLGHVLILVGYEDYGNVFIVKNSHGGGKLLRITFENGKKCDFAHSAWQIMPGSTYKTLGLGKKFCPRLN